MFTLAGTSSSSIDWASLWRTLTYQIPLNSNTATVLRGTAVLGLACGVVGTFLLLRKRSLVADALSHAALPGMCVGFLAAYWLANAMQFNIDPKSLMVLIPGAAIFGLVGVMCVHLLSQTPRVKEDAAIGVVLSVFFALGVVLLSIIQQSGIGNIAGLNQFIFGQAATMSRADSNLIAALAFAVIAMAALAYKELKALCFDRQFARSLGWSTNILDGILLAMVTVLTVIGLNAVGAVLMVALLIIPPAAARFWTERMSFMIALAAIFGAASCHVGTAFSAVVDDLPTGPAITVACGALFIASMFISPQRGLISALVQRIAMAGRIARQHVLRAMYEHEEIVGKLGVPVRVADLMQRRSWSQRVLHRVIRCELRRGEIARAGGGFILTESGRHAAARIVRTHRIWEHFLTTQADIAPSHVDRAADDIEHVLSDELVADLEAELRERGALKPGEFVPESAHRLAPKAVRT